MRRAQVEQVHRLADVQQAVRVVLETELLARVVEVSLDQEIRAERRLLAGVGAAAPEALLPLRAGAVGDGGDFARELHARVRRDVVWVVVEAAVPVWVHHERLALGVAEGDAVGVAARAAGDADHFVDARGEVHAHGEGLHAAHAGADGGVEFGDAEGVDEAHLRPDHVVHCQDWEAGCVGFGVGGVEAGGTC